MEKKQKCGCNARRRQIREGRLEIVAELYKRGYSYRKIRSEVMARLGLPTYSIRTVQNDVQFLLNEWREARIKDVDLLVSLELECINKTIEEAWDQWYRSKQDLSKETQKQTGIPTGGMDTEGGDPRTGDIAILKLESNKTSEEQLGDPRYLAEIRKQHIERRKLLGLYAPEKKDVTGDLTFASVLMESGMLDLANEEEED